MNFVVAFLRTLLVGDVRSAFPSETGSFWNAWTIEKHGFTMVKSTFLQNHVFAPERLRTSFGNDFWKLWALKTEEFPPPKRSRKSMRFRASFWIRKYLILTTFGLHFGSLRRDKKQFGHSETLLGPRGSDLRGFWSYLGSTLDRFGVEFPSKFAPCSLCPKVCWALARNIHNAFKTAQNPQLH